MTPANMLLMLTDPRWRRRERAVAAKYVEKLPDDAIIYAP